MTDDWKTRMQKEKKKKKANKSKDDQKSKGKVLKTLLEVPTYIELMEFINKRKETDPTGMLERLYENAADSPKRWKKIVEDTLQALRLYVKEEPK